MGKMKALLIDNMENVKTYPLSTILEEGQQEHEDLSMYEEAHYHHAISDIVSLIEVHGWSKVIGDVRENIWRKTWQ
jgi:hypothetical protein